MTGELLATEIRLVRLHHWQGFEGSDTDREKFREFSAQLERCYTEFTFANIRQAYSDPQVERYLTYLEQTAKTLGPTTHVAPTRVDAPTISATTSDIDGSREVTVQWYGESYRGIPPGTQFYFGLSPVLSDPRWCVDPEMFQVVFLGQVQHWPRSFRNNQVTKFLADYHSSARVLWAVTAKFCAFETPASVLTLVSCIGDINCGVISPAPSYFSPQVLAEETAKLADRS